MDQVKIGMFIAQCRREKNMTQRQLAEKLGLSDKTISKWETGKGLPEAGFMAPLSEILGISVNELLTGERIPDEEYQERAEETMVISYHAYSSIGWAILHGILGWVYVIYYIIRY